MFEKKDDKKEEIAKKDEKKSDVKHVRTEGQDTHHDLLPETPVERVTDAKTRVVTVEQGVETEVNPKKD